MASRRAAKIVVGLCPWGVAYVTRRQYAHFAGNVRRNKNRSPLYGAGNVWATERRLSQNKKRQQSLSYTTSEFHGVRDKSMLVQRKMVRSGAIEGVCSFPVNNRLCADCR